MENNYNNQDSIKLTDLLQSNDDDEFVIGKGFEVDESVELKKENRKRRRKSALKTTIWITSIFAVAIALSVFGIYALFDFLGIGFGRGENCQVYIKPGSSMTEISKQLQEAGAVKVPFLFNVYSKLKGHSGRYKYGLYTFNNESGYSKLADMLINEGAKAESVTVTIPEGVGIRDYVRIIEVDGEEKEVVTKGIATILEEKKVCSKEDFYDALKEVKLEGELLENCNDGRTYNSLEGYLFPDTYEFFAYDSPECARMVVEKMIKNAENKITKDMYKKAEDAGYNMNQILTMASIIQMEAGNNPDEMPKVAAVFYNRMNDKTSETGGELGSSPTCYYGNSYKNDDGRYNTYEVKGLPPGPLCSPGLDAIKAAINPAQNSPYFYFVTDSDGAFYYHKTLDEQNVTISILKEQEKWIYEKF